MLLVTWPFLLASTASWRQLATPLPIRTIWWIRIRFWGLLDYRLATFKGLKLLIEYSLEERQITSTGMLDTGNGLGQLYHDTRKSYDGFYLKRIFRTVDPTTMLFLMKMLIHTFVTKALRLQWSFLSRTIIITTSRKLSVLLKVFGLLAIRFLIRFDCS